MHEIPEIRKFYRIKAFVILGIILLSGLAYTLLLMSQMQTEAVAKQEQSNRRFFSSTLSYLNSNAREISNLIADYHINNNIMLDNLVEAFSGNNYLSLMELPVEDQTRLLYNASHSMENCAWMLIVDRNGNVLISDNESNVGMNIIHDTGNEMDLLEFADLCIEDTDYIVISNPYEADENFTGNQLYLYCKAIPGTYDQDGSKYILLAFTSQIIDTMEDTMEDLSAWVNDSTIINGGTAFVTDASKDIVMYGSLNGQDLTGSKASELGFGSEVLTSGFTGIVEIAGTKCYVSTRKFSSELYGEDFFITSVVPFKNLYSINPSVVIWNITLLIVALFLVTFYCSYIRGRLIKRGEVQGKKKLFKIKGVTIYYSGILARKILPVVLAAEILIGFGVTYFQTLIMLSDAFSDAVSIETDIMSDMEKNSQLQKEFKSYYNMQYISRAELIGVIMTLNGSSFLNVKEGMIGNSKALQELRSKNDVVNIYLVSDDGSTLLTSSNYWNLTLPSEPTEELYGFWDVVNGKSDNYIEDGKATEEGIVSKYVGCPMYYYTYTDENENQIFTGYIDYIKENEEETNAAVFTEAEPAANPAKEIIRHRGLVLVEVLAQEIDFVLDSSRPQYVLENTTISGGGFLTGYKYDEEADDYKVFYSQNQSLVGNYAKELGVSENAFSGSYNGFHAYNKELYLESFRQGEDYFISTAMPIDSLYDASLRTAKTCGIYAFVAMLIIALLMILVSDYGEEKLYKESHDPFALFGNGLSSERWKEKTSPHKFEEIIKNNLFFVGAVFLLSMIREGYRLGEYSALLYIVGGQWDRGLHIFSLSACILITIVSAVLISIFGRVAHLMAEAFGNRVVTMMNMIIALTKTVAVAVVLFYCLYIIGIDGRSLLASAGVMSVVVGLGAQSLVGDLLAGIFIILEGSLRVGDHVTIDGVSGKVIDIGLRTTRYEDGNQNIRVICNNELKNFVNMSMKYTVVFFTISVACDSDFKKIKTILNTEFLSLYEEHRFLKGIPVCLGIESFGESAVNLKIKFMCEESERGNVEMFMRDEIVRIFAENDIIMPYNQLDVHIDHE